MDKSDSLINSKAKVPLCGAPHHLERVAELFRSQRECHDFSTCDLRIELNNGFELLHSAVAGAHSFTFSKIFSRNRPPHAPYDMRRFNGRSVRKVVDWMYFGELPMSEERLRDDLAVVSHLRMPFLHRQMEQHLKKLADVGDVFFALNVASSENAVVTTDTMSHLGHALHEILPSITKHEIRRLEPNAAVGVAALMLPTEKKLALINLLIRWIGLVNPERDVIRTVVNSITIKDARFDALSAFRRTLLQFLLNQGTSKRTAVMLDEKEELSIQLVDSNHKLSEVHLKRINKTPSFDRLSPPETTSSTDSDSCPSSEESGSKEDKKKRQGSRETTDKKTSVSPSTSVSSSLKEPIDPLKLTLSDIDMLKPMAKYFDGTIKETPEEEKKKENNPSKESPLKISQSDVNHIRALPNPFLTQGPINSEAPLIPSYVKKDQLGWQKPPEKQKPSFTESEVEEIKKLPVSFSNRESPPTSEKSEEKAISPIIRKNERDESSTVPIKPHFTRSEIVEIKKLPVDFKEPKSPSSAQGRSTSSMLAEKTSTVPIKPRFTRSEVDEINKTPVSFTGTITSQSPHQESDPKPISPMSPTQRSKGSHMIEVSKSELDMIQNMRKQKLARSIDKKSWDYDSEGSTRLYR
ncbi:unnamed protein product [Caenorhabditis auriculariae]|uniref:BTB domain-containing protein n=1 Tax=Caenorhabditis auriculariae TaxID=2777116 RepID=A0A8S1H949_9PELO|nr:unnamed protein product [Caenorhabditis auriculariae]